MSGIGTPVFRRLMEIYRELSEAERESPEGRALFAEAMHNAPPEFQRVIDQVAEELKLIPDRPDGYDDDGNPLYSMSQLAAHLGIDQHEFGAHVAEFDEVRERLGLPPLQPYNGTVHRVQ